MGGSPTPTTQTTTQELSPEQRQILNLAMPNITNFAASTPQRYQGETVPGFNPNEAAGQASVLSQTGNIQQLADNASNANNFYTSGQIWDPNNNPALAGSIDAATRPLYQNLTNTVLPAIRTDATQTGNYGSSRQGVAEGLATQSTQQAASDAANKIAEQEYETNVAAQQRAEALVPTLQSADTTAGVTQSGVGDVQRALDQAQTNEAVQNFNYDQYAPFLQSQDLVSLLQGLPGGSTVTTGNTPAPNTAGQALGGAAAGASLGTAIGGPGVGTAAGALGGALLPFLFR